MTTKTSSTDGGVQELRKELFCIKKKKNRKAFKLSKLNMPPYEGNEKRERNKSTWNSALPSIAGKLILHVSSVPKVIQLH